MAAGSAFDIHLKQSLRSLRLSDSQILLMAHLEELSDFDT